VRESLCASRGSAAVEKKKQKNTTWIYEKIMVRQIEESDERIRESKILTLATALFLTFMCLYVNVEFLFPSTFVT
jgi:hypothetical protein